MQFAPYPETIRCYMAASEGNAAPALKRRGRRPEVPVAIGYNLGVIFDHLAQRVPAILFAPAVPAAEDSA